MGICNEGNSILLIFDCIGKGRHEINTFDGLTLNTVLKRLSKRINTPVSEIGNILYNYDVIDKSRTIRELNLPSGAVISVKFKEDK